jgi:cytochrome c biogenesis protein CcmG/thiol:disulfide interchange protein DsbE
VKRVLSFVFAALLLTFVACKNDKPAQIGTQAPDFTVSDGQKTVTLSQFRGKPVVLNFWATWCPPCIEEVPSIVAMQKEMGDKVVVLAVSIDVDNDAYKNFTAKRMPGVLTVRDGDQKAANLFGTYGWPETYIIDSKGVIRRKFIGAQDWTSPEIIDYLTKLSS